MIIIRIIFTFLLFYITNVIGADLNLSGYITQSAVKSNGVSVGDSKGDWSFDKREITLFGDKDVGDWDIKFAIGNTDEPGLEDDKIFIKYLLADRRFKSDDFIYGIRLGRVPHSLGFYNKLRNMPNGTPLVYMPNGIYREQFKYLAMSGDGIQGYIDWEISPRNNIGLTLTKTRPTLSNNSEIVAGHFNDGNVGSFKRNSSWVNGITLEGQFSQLQVYYNWTNLQFDFEANPMLPFPQNMIFKSGKNDTRVHTVGAKYFFMNGVDIGIEYLQIEEIGEPWENIFKFIKHQGPPKGLILSAKWDFAPKHSVMVYHNEYYADSGDKDGKLMQAQTGMPAHTFYTKSNSIAYKYDLDTKWSFKIQHTRGTGTEPFVENVNPVTKKEWNYTAAQVVYSF
jgi:hypothetical protein